MIEKLTLSDVNIPYGILHDQKLLSVKEKGNSLIFTFGIEVYEENYCSDFYLKYKDFNRCDMTINMAEEPVNSFEFFTMVDNHGKTKGLSLDIKDFIDAINDSNSTFVNCKTNGYEFSVELSTSFYNSSNHKKFKKYVTSLIEINCNGTVTWDWYKK